MNTDHAITIQDILAAAKRLQGHARVTPLHENSELNAQAGGRVLLKLENMQLTGSFKFRGAYNRLSQLNEEQRRRGVVAWSSGNHAQGIAAAGQMLGVATRIVMPSDAPRIKVDNTKSWGADIVFYDRHTEDREEIGRRLTRELGATLVPSYDDVDIICGQGTAGLEACQQATQSGHQIDAALICCGGGGLSAGSAVAIRHNFPAADICTVEPEQFDDTRRSLEKGCLVGNAPGASSICDALLAAHPGTITFPLLRKAGCRGLAVSDQEVKAAMRFAFATLKMVVEPGGAVALAAILSRKIAVSGKTVLVVVSGGNVDPQQFAEIVTASPA